MTWCELAAVVCTVHCGQICASFKVKHTHFVKMIELAIETKISKPLGFSCMFNFEY